MRTSTARPGARLRMTNRRLESLAGQHRRVPRCPLSLSQFLCRIEGKTAYFIYSSVASIMKIRLALLLTLIFSAAPTIPSFGAAERVALVIGNAKYPDADAPLKEPI